MEFDGFTLASDAQTVMIRLIREVDEFVHLADARIACVQSSTTPTLRGAPCQAFIGVPSVQGPYAPLFDWMLGTLCGSLFEEEAADFVMIIGAQIWAGLDGVRRERLIFHELKHVVVREDAYGVPKIGRDGRAMLRLIPHDYEFFDSEVRRYGADVCGVVGAAVAIAAGGRRGERRARFRVA